MRQLLQETSSQQPGAPRAVRPGRPTKVTLVAYGALSMPVWIAIIPIVNYLPAFYAKELELSVGVVGLVFLLARLWDGMADLLVGWLSDRSRSRWGRRKPWVILASPCLMVSTWFLCNPPQGAGVAYLIVWAALFYTAWTALYVPYLSWGAELTTDYIERSRVTSFREAFTMLGNLCFAAAPLVFLTSDAPLRQVLLLIALAVICLVPLATIPLALFVHDPPATEQANSHLLQAIRALVKDKVLVRFIAAVLLIWTGEGVINSLVIFAFNVGLDLPNKFLWVLFIIYVATISALPLTLRLGKRFEKHRLLSAAIAVKALGFAAHVWVPAGNFPIVVSLWIVVGAAHASALVLPTSILADIIDHGDVAEGERRSGAYVAIFNLAVKIGLALGIGLAFGLLAFLHYDPRATHYTATDVWNIRLLAFALPALLEAVSIAVLLQHPITRTVQQQLRRVIDARTTLGHTV